MADKTYTLQTNPIVLLNVSLRHTRQQIIEFAEEASLTKNQVDCSKARSVLVNPKYRIYAELSWLPGVSPQSAKELLVNSDIDTFSFLNDQNIPQLTKINVICNRIEQGLFLENQDCLFQLLDPLTYLIDSIDLLRLLNDINEDRIIAKFPLVTNIGILQEALSHRVKGVVTTVINGLDAINSGRLLEAMNKYAETWTSSGRNIQSHFAEAVLDNYETQSYYFLNADASAINIFNRLINQSSAESNDSLLSSLKDLKISIKNWVNVARPVQLLYEARGLKHTISRTVAGDLIDTAFYLNFELKFHDEALDIANFCLSEFWILSDLRESINADISRLTAVEEIQSFKATLGCIVRTDLELKDQIIIFKKHRLNVKDITRLRWAVCTVDSNLIHYKIGWGNEREEVLLLTFKKKVFEQFRDILLQQIGYRLLFENIITELRKGIVYSFPSISIADDYVILKKRRFFSESQSQSFGWKEVILTKTNHSIRIKAKNDSSYYADIAYLKFWNINLLSILIDANLAKEGVDRLSRSYEG